MIADPAVLICNDRLGGVLKEGMEDALGHAAAEAVFTQAGLPVLQSVGLEQADLGLLLAAMQRLFGSRSGRGMAVCTGRACFKYALQAFGADMGWYEMSFRLRPPAARITAGLEVIAQVIRPAVAVEISSEQDKFHTYWHLKPAAAIDADGPGAPACQLVIGVLQEFLYWAGGGKYYPVEEKACILNGAAACLLAIARQPVD